LSEWLKHYDAKAYEFINLRLTADSWDGFMRILSSRVLWVIVVSIALPFLAFRKNSRGVQIVLASLLALCASDAITYYLLKPGFSRVRPCYTFESTRRLASDCGSQFGMPSNHAANGMAVTFTLGLFAGRAWLLIAMVTTFAVGFSRIYLGVHYPGDILAGFVVGGLTGLLTWAFFLKWIKSK
jgi:undecaprenyl-diphosphatase